MNRKVVLAVVIVVALVVVALIGWWLASPLFVDNQVDEAFPFELPSTEAMAEMSPEQKAAEAERISAAVSESAEMPAEMVDEAEEVVQELSADMPDKPMAEEMPADEWIAAAQGQFADADSFHQGSGTATVYQLANERILRFEDFEVTNGPDLHVLLVTNIDGTSHEDIGEYVDLGSLKGNIGNQNYEIPEDVDLGRYSGVMIYCMPFHVVFATADFGG